MRERLVAGLAGLAGLDAATAFCGAVTIGLEAGATLGLGAAATLGFGVGTAATAVATGALGLAANLVSGAAFAGSADWLAASSSCSACIQYLSL